MTWLEAMERYGTDKPDMRFGMELVDLGEVFAATEFRAFQAGRGEGHPGARARPTWAATSSTRSSTGPRQLGAAGLVWMRVGEGGALDVAGRQVPSATPSSSGSSTPRRASPATCC